MDDDFANYQKVRNKKNYGNKGGIFGINSFSDSVCIRYLFL